MDLHPISFQFGFSAAYAVDASLAADAPEGVRTLLLLIYPYASWGAEFSGCPRISTYYFAAQKAYLQAREMVRRLKEMGESACLCSQVRLKPLLSRLKDFSQGRNTLHYHKDYGSRFHVQAIGLEAYRPMEQDILRQGPGRDMCGSCRKCFKNCPTKALTEDGFQRDRCLRQHMLRTTPVPAELRPLMGNRLLGCDICQQVCPYNAALPEGESNAERFPIASLLAGDEAILESLSGQIGRNMALPNRVCAQACLVAGNSGNVDYLPALRKLADHPSRAVAEHAAWAVKKLTNEADKTTL